MSANAGISVLNLRRRLRAVVARRLLERALDRRALRGDRDDVAAADLVEEERAVRDADARGRLRRARAELVVDDEQADEEREQPPAEARPRRRRRRRGASRPGSDGGVLAARCGSALTPGTMPDASAPALSSLSRGPRPGAHDRPHIWTRSARGRLRLPRARAAIAGAIAAALAELAARFSDEREAAGRLVELRTRLVELADEDAEAYTAFMQHEERRGPRPDDRRAARDRRGRRRRWASIARAIAEGGNPRVAGDAIAGAELAAAVARVGAELVEINLGGTADATTRPGPRCGCRRAVAHGRGYAPSPWRSRCHPRSRSRRPRRCGRSPTSPPRSGSSRTRSSCTAATRRRSSLGVLDRLADRPDGKLDRRHRDHADAGGRGQDDDVGLADAGLRQASASAPSLCLREASLGPVFGDQGRRRRRRLRAGRADGGHQPPLHRRHPRDRRPRTTCSRRCSTRTSCTATTLGIDPLTIYVAALRST